MSDLKTPTSKPDRLTKTGCWLWDSGHWHSDRYQFDFKLCTRNNGWRQFDTDQDAHYFGVWVHIERRLTVTYCEGDVSIVWAPSVNHLRAELQAAEKFYGAPPPAFVVLGSDGTRTDIYDKRPEA